jgi:hypothetical protein
MLFTEGISSSSFQIALTPSGASAFAKMIGLSRSHIGKSACMAKAEYHL